IILDNQRVGVRRQGFDSLCGRPYTPAAQSVVPISGFPLRGATSIREGSRIGAISLWANGNWMFEGLSKRLGDVFDKLRGRGALSEADVDAALQEVRTALLEADVAFPSSAISSIRSAPRRLAPTSSARSRRARWSSRSSTTTWSRCWAAPWPT